MLDLRKRLADIMNEIQKSKTNHKKYITILSNLYKEVDTELFYSCFQNFITLILSVPYKPENPNIERALDFAACVIATIGSTVHRRIFNHVLKFQNLEDDHLRYRACQFVSKLAKNLVGTSLGDELVDEIEDAMFERLMDGRSDVRAQAVMALHCLQDSNDDECPIVAKLLLHMQKDATVTVRKVCVENILLTKPVLEALIIRTRDTKAQVRLAAFTRLSQYPKHVQIIDRHAIIKNGFYDTSATVKHYVLNRLIQEWLVEYENDYSQFFKAMRLDSSEKDLNETNEVMGIILDAIFKNNKNVFEGLATILNVSEERVVPLDLLDIDTVILWTRLTCYLRKSEYSEDLLTQILPDLVEFIQYLKRYEKSKAHKDLEHDFILKQLLTITCGYDFTEPYGCKALNQFIQWFLMEVDVSESIIAVLINNIEKSMPNVDDRLTFIMHIINDMRYACIAEEVLKKQMEVKNKIADVQGTLDGLRKAQVQILEEQDYITAAKNHSVILELEKTILNLKESLDVKDDVPLDNTDPIVLLKCLKIFCAVLKSPQTTKLCPTIRTLMNELIMPNITNETDYELCLAALECYALCCLLDHDSAIKGIQIFCLFLLRNVNEDVDVVHLKLAIKSTSDLITCYGADLLKHCEAFEIDMQDFIQILTNLLNHEDHEVEELAVTGLCNLIFSEQVLSPSLISHLILKWCSPATDCLLQQQISSIFDELPRLQDAGHYFDKCALMTVKTILKAPTGSPLADVDVQNIFKFCLALCSMCDEDNLVIYNLAVKICCDIKDNPGNEENGTLSKLLLMIDVSGNRKYMIEDLLHICEEMENELANDTEENIIKFMSRLKNFEDKGATHCNTSIEV